LATLVVGQNVVGLTDLLELLFGFGVALVGVRVVLAGEFPVRLLDLVSGSSFSDTEGLVVVLLKVVLGAHRRPFVSRGCPGASPTDLKPPLNSSWSRARPMSSRIGSRSVSTPTRACSLTATRSRSTRLR